MQEWEFEQRTLVHRVLAVVFSGNVTENCVKWVFRSRNLDFGGETSIFGVIGMQYVAISVINKNFSEYKVENIEITYQ